MKRIFTKISAFCLLSVSLLGGGCLADETENPNSNSGSGTTDSTIPGNSVIDARIFEALDLNYPGLSAVKAYYEADQYYLAARALLEYYRSRTDVTNGNVNLIAPSITADEQLRADWALSANEYCFYVEGYMNGSKPYSYKVSNKLDWTLWPSKEANQRYGLHRLQWMVPQGKAYRITLDETYAQEWVATYQSWFEQFPCPEGDFDFEADPASVADEKQREQLYAWRPIDVAYRIEDQCDLLYYFMQSTNFTPQLLSKFLSNMVEQTNHIKTRYSQDEEVKAKEAHAVFRAGTIFPEMKKAQEWVESGKSSMNNGIDTQIFDVLNLDYSGLAKVNRAYQIGDYYKALEELLVYYRTRTHGLNPNIDLTTVTATDSERRWADMALAENDYRFYVKGFFENASNEIPYSYRSGEGINWQLWPTKDQEERYQLHRHQWMLPQAKTYYVTRDEKYVKNWIEVYGDWLKQNPKADIDLDYTLYPENQAAQYRNAGWSWRPLDVAARILDQCAMLECYQESPSITIEWLCDVLWHLDEQVNHIIKNYSETSNHLITQAQSVTFAGVLFPELKNAQKWIDSGAGVLNNEVTAQYFADGWLKDGDFHYHISSIEDFRSAMLLAQKNGLSNRFPAGYVSAMRNMTEVVMNMIYPNYSVPNMTDTRRKTWTKSVLKKNLDRYVELFPENQEMLWMATEGVSGTKPATKIKTFPDAGYYILRSGWTNSDMMMVLENTTQSPKEQWHRQWDNNTFELFVKGRNFFPDSGCFTYGGTSSSNTERAKYAATKAHSTLTLDGANVTTCRGKMLLQESKSTSSFDYQVLVLENASYANLTHRRTAFLVADKFYVLLDEAYGSAEGEVGLHFHLTDATDSEVVLNPSAGGCYTAFADGNNLLVTSFAASGVSKSFNAQESYVSYNTDEKIARKAYKLSVKKAASDAAVRVVTVLLPSSDPASETVAASIDGDWSSRGATVRVTVGGTSYKLSYSL